MSHTEQGHERVCEFKCEKCARGDGYVLSKYLHVCACVEQREAASANVLSYKLFLGSDNQ